MTRLAIINENIPKYDQLLNNIKPDTIIEVIPEDVNGITLLYEIIQKYSNIESLHIISHGIPGKIHLGKNKLDLEQLSEYTYFENIKQFFSENSEILLYGCNVAAYEKGKLFIDTFAEKTGLTVTGSTNVIGHSNLRGSWELNYSSSDLTTLNNSTGNSYREIIITEQGQQEWCDTLTHYRGGTLNWTSNGAGIITMVVTTYWRHNSGIDELFSPTTEGTWTGGVPDLPEGTVVNTPGITDGVNTFDKNEQTFVVDYTGAGAGPSFIVNMQSGARISTLINAPDASFGLETVVYPTSTNGSPVSNIPPIIRAVIDKNDWTFTIPSSHPNSLPVTFTLPDTNLGGMYGTWPQITTPDTNGAALAGYDNTLADIQVDLNTGVLSLDTTNFTVGHQYSVVVIINDTSTTIPVDFILEFVASEEVPVISSGDLVECVFAGLTYEYNFTASIPSDPTTVLTWSYVNDPTNSTIDISVPNTLSMTFSPDQSQVGNSYIINFTVTHPTHGTSAYLNVTFTVKKANIDDLVGIFNCAIKTIGVQCDTLNGLGRILCLREKKVEIWKNGQDRSEELRDKLKKCKD